MKKWTEEELINAKHRIRNAKIKSVNLDMEDHGCITLRMTIEGCGWGTNYGGYSLGHGYVGAKEFDSDRNAMVYIMRIMDTVGVSRFNDLVGEYVRVAEGPGHIVKIIGNILEDKWFDAESFFEDAEKEEN